MLSREVCAAERCRRGGLRRIIWLPDAVTGERPEQQAFIEALQRDVALQFGADLMRGGIGDIEPLKGAMHLALGQIEAPAAPAAAPGRAHRPVVHVLMSEADRAASVPLLKLLDEQGLEATSPVFAGKAAEVRKANAQLLASCDAVILFYGAGDEVWKVHEQNNLRKQSARADASGRRSEWICLVPPASADKQHLRQRGKADLIDMLDGDSVAALRPLLASLVTQGATP